MPSNSDNRPRVGGGWLRKVPRQRVLIVLGAVALAELLFWFVAVRPLSDRELEQQALLTVLATQVEQRQESLEQLRAAGERVNSARDNGDLLLDELTFDR